MKAGSYLSGILHAAIGTGVVFGIGVIVHDVWRWYSYLLLAVIIYMISIHQDDREIDSGSRY